MPHSYTEDCPACNGTVKPDCQECSGKGQIDPNEGVDDFMAACWEETRKKNEAAHT